MNKNYSLIDQQPLAEIEGTGFLYRHRSGARIIHLSNGDDNKVFSITFKTPPQDDTGLPHILEHCVLAGSQKYNVKEPFNELMKGSLYTYLNAMTYSDKTVYPIASRNEKDFLNLMDVYLDAVFNPAIYQKDEAFLQEGWHYHLDGPSSPLTVNGVVYNEMKGAYSSPYDMLDNMASKALFPHSPYRFDSGGDPACIPALTYEAFLDFHKKYYHPANSYIFFYGNLDIGFCLDKLDREYLSRYDYEEIPSSIEYEEAFSAPAYVSEAYSVTERKENGNYAGVSYVISPCCFQLEVAFELLDYILMKNQASPLKKKLEELGEEVSCWFSPHSLQPTWNVIVKNTSLTGRELEKIVDETLRGLAENGLDRDLVEAGLTYYEFLLREENYGRSPRGLAYNINLLKGWIYGADPFDFLYPIEELTRLKGKEGHFEDLICKYLVNNNHKAVLTLYPEENLDAKREEETARELEKTKAGLSSEETDRIIRRGEELLQYQETPDPPEELAKIPFLSLEDISQEGDYAHVVQKGEKGGDFLHCPLPTRGIGYVNLFFDITEIDEKYSVFVYPLIYLLGKVSTEKRGYEALSSDVARYLGGLDFRFETAPGEGSAFRAFVVVRAKALYGNISKLFELVKEITDSSLFDDAVRIKRLLLELASKMENSYWTDGRSAAMSRALSACSPWGAFKESLSGVDFYLKFKDMLKNIDGHYQQIAESLRHLLKSVFCVKRLTVGGVFDNEYSSAFQTSLTGFISGLRQGEENTGEKSWAPKFYGKDEAFVIPSRVQYNCFAAYLGQEGITHTGVLNVLANVLDNGYLLPEIRTKSGAYGYGAVFSKKGDMYLYSYRDPALTATIDVYKNLPGFVKSIDYDKAEMTKNILGAINELDRPLHVEARGYHELLRHFSGITRENLQRERRKALSCTPGELRSLAGLMEKALSNGSFCVFGGEGPINANKGLFSQVYKI